MALRLTGEEFIKKILAGERDFKGIILQNFNLSGHELFQEMQNYLKKQDLEKNPIDLSESQLNEVIAIGLFLPFVQAERAHLWRADFSKAYLAAGNFKSAFLLGANFAQAKLRKVNFEKAYLFVAKFSEAYLFEANFTGAILEEANLEKADIKKVNFHETDLRNANLIEVKNLETVLNLAYAKFGNTKVTEKEKEIIEEALGERLFYIIKT